MKNKALLSIVSDSVNIEKMLIESGGELTPEIAEMLQVTEAEMSSKVDAYHMIIERFDALKNHYLSRSDYFKTISKQCENASRRLKDNIKIAMINLGTDEIKGNDMRFKLVDGAGSLVIEDEEMIPVEYKEVVIETVILKDKLKEDLKKDIEIPGARIEPTSSVRTYANIPERKTKKTIKGGSDE
jgi:Siphovirus Gp157